MNITLTKKQLATMAGILGTGIVLALLILFSTPEPHEASAPAAHDDTVRLTDAQIAAAGIAILTAGPQPIRTIVTLPGAIHLNADRTAQVVALLGGTVQAVRAGMGRTVRRGDILAVIGSGELSDLRSALLTAEQRLQGARTTFDREQRLWEEKISAEQDVIGARQALQEAQIARNNARQKLAVLGTTPGAASLSHYELRAPIAGVVVDKQVALGQSVKADTVLFTVSDLATVWADVAVPSGDLDKVHAGATVLVTSGAATATGTIAWIGAALGAQTRTATARVVLANPAGAWRPGTFVNAAIDATPDGRPVPVAVAATAIHDIDGQPALFVRVPGGFTARSVTLGRRDATHVEVVKGLAAGAQYAGTGSFVIKAELGKSSEAPDH